MNGCWWRGHRWTVVERHFTASRWGAKLSAEVANEGTLDLMGDAMFGFTSVEERCEVCGKTEFQHVQGDVTR